MVRITAAVICLGSSQSSRIKSERECQETSYRCWRVGESVWEAMPCNVWYGGTEKAHNLQVSHGSRPSLQVSQ